MKIWANFWPTFRFFLIFHVTDHVINFILPDSHSTLYLEYFRYKNIIVSVISGKMPLFGQKTPFLISRDSDVE